MIDLRMKKRKRHSKGIAVKGGLFRKTFLMLTGMSLLTVIAMLIYFNYIAAKNNQERYDDIRKDQLERMSVYISGELSSIQNTEEQLIRNTDTIALMVDPKGKNSEAGYRVLAQLATAVSQNTMIRKSMLYQPTVDMVYSSAGSYVDLDKFTKKEEIKAYLKLREKKRKKGAESQTLLFDYNGCLYLACDYCVPNFIGAVIVEIDSNTLSNLLAGSSEKGNDDFILLDYTGKLLSIGIDSDEENYTAIKDEVESAARGAVARPEGSSFAVGKYMFTNSDEWGYILGIGENSGGAPLPVGSILITLLPFMIIYVLFAEFYSLYITNIVYKPINRLMQLTAKSQDGSIAMNKGMTEADYLEEEFQNTMGQNRQHKELLESVAADVTKQMFRGILMDNGDDVEYIRKTMDGLGFARYLDGKYSALAGRIVTTHERELSQMEIGMYQRSLLALLGDSFSGDFIKSEFFVDQGNLAVLFCFPEEASVLQIKTITTKICDYLTESVSALPYSIALGRGKVYTDITSLRASYKEALSQINYQEYQKDQKDQKDQLPGQAASQILPAEQEDGDQKYFNERGHHLAESAEKDSLEDVIRSSDSLAAELAECSHDNLAKYLEMIMDILIEKMIETHITPEEVKEMGISALIRRTEEAKDVAELHDGLKTLFSKAGEAIHTNSRKNRYKYVDVAKAYIAEHYSDGDLSLNEVGEAAGISAPYLSGIFTEVYKGGFSTYLSQFRVQQAMLFLQETTLGIAEIGYKCGFNSPQSFSRVFKKQTGMSPGKYREHILENQGGQA